MSDSQLSVTKSILLARFTDCGDKVKISTERDQWGTPYILVSYGDVPYDEAMSIATTPGVFEMRVQTEDNGSEHICYGDGVYVASVPTSMGQSNGAESWGVSFSLNSVARDQFRQACIDSGATTDPDAHPVMMFLDGQMVCSKPLSPELARDISDHPVDTLLASTGTGEEGRAMAKKLSMCLRSGALPVELEVAAG